MADLSDVETAIVNICSAALYPNGTGAASILPGAASVRISRGWPIPATLDADLAAGNAEITVYPLSGSYSNTYQLLDQTYEISPAVIAMGVSINGNVITVTGQPATGEYLTVIVDEVNVYSSNASSASAILSALATAAQAKYPSASSTATTLTIPANFSIVVRQGGQATMGKVIHRQHHSIMVSTWAPSDALRTAIVTAIDVALKTNNKLSMPDTSQALLVYSRTMSSDQQEKAALYRRDLIFETEYATVLQFPGYVITSVTTSIISAVNASTIAVAVAGGEDESLEPTFGFDFSDPDDSQYIPTT